MQQCDSYQEQKETEIMHTWLVDKDLYLGCGLPFTIFCPYLRHRYPSPDIPTSPAACTTNLGFFSGFTGESE